MKSIKVLLLVLLVTVVSVKGDPVEDFTTAFNSLSDPMKTAFNALGGLGDNGGFFNSLLDIVKCISEKILPIDVCNFQTSLDPFYYLNQCANGTLALEIIQKLAQNIPQAKIPFGIPPTVSKDRCFSPIPSLPDLPAAAPSGIGI